MPRFDAASRDTDKFTRKIHFPGPRIEVRGDTVRITCGVIPFVIPHPMRDPENPGEGPRCYSSYVMNWTPHHVRGDTVRIEYGVTRTALLWWDTWAIVLSV